MPSRVEAPVVQVGQWAQKEGEKFCTQCGSRKPFDEFHKDTEKADGHKDVCKECRAANEELKKQAELDERLAKLEEEGLEKLSELQTGGTLSPHINELLESIMHSFGGTYGFARTIRATFLASKPGSQGRIKLLHMITELTKAVTKHDLAERRLEHMEDRDLLEVMRSCLQEYQERNDLAPDALPPLEVTAISPQEHNA